MQETKLNVKLLYYTKDPQRAVATAARLCYSPVGAKDLINKMTDEQAQRVLSTILESGHNSTLEHASYTFAIEGVSRACTHQLVRHRLASFNQQSQRYVKIKSGLEVVVPETVKNNEKAAKALDKAIQAAEDAYHEMIEEGIPAEDARYVLPNAAETKIVVTMNIRELLHFFSVRLCTRAQWEIRQLAQAMYDLAYPTAPFIFADAGPECVRTKCKEGKMSCGKSWKKVDRKNLKI